jgi:nucleoid-associated protein YgaU
MAGVRRSSQAGAPVAGQRATQFEKAFLVPLYPESATHIPVQFNPEEYTLTKEVNYAEATIPGLNSPVLQFVNGQTQTLDMELFLDTYEEQGTDVREWTTAITDLMTTIPSTHAPPVVLFVWGSLRFVCVVARVTQKFILFRPDGIPVRARLQVQFREFADPDLQSKANKHETADYSKLHTVCDGETLSTIAARLYEDPQLWRPIALANGIDNPRELATGQRLVVPQLPYRDPLTGEVVL